MIRERARTIVAGWRRDPLPVLVLAACAVTVLIFGTWRVQCPGLYYDELLWVEGWQRPGRVAWRVGEWPMMALSYLGAIKSWLYWPVRDHLSASIVRVPWVLTAVVCLVLASLICRRIAGRTAGLMVPVVLAVDPAFLFLHRLDWGPVAIATLLRMISLVLVLRWRVDGGAARLVGAAFLIGLGLYDKIIFAWYVAALGAAVLATWRWWPRPTIGVVVTSVLAFVVGAAPLLAYNVSFPGATFTANPILATESLAHHLVSGATVLADTLSGAGLYGFVNAQPLIWPIACPDLPRWLARVGCGYFPLTGAWLPLATVVALMVVVTTRKVREVFAVRFLAVLSVAIAVIMLPVAQATGAHHVAMLLPFPQMLLAVVVVEAARLRSRWRLPLRLVLGGVIVTGLAVSTRTLVSFGGLCGRGVWSPATYALSQFAAAHSHDRILLGDWGFANQLRALAPAATLDDWSWALLEDRATAADLRLEPGRRTFLMLHTRAASVFGAARPRALRHVRAAGLRARLVATARDRDGRATALVLELVPHRRAAGWRRVAASQPVPASVDAEPSF